MEGRRIKSDRQCKPEWYRHAGGSMMLSRRQFIELASAAVGAATLHSSAWSQLSQPHYPARPVRVIVTFAPGGTVDVFTRIVAQKLSDRFGKQFYVENVAGATGNIGVGQAAKASPDGHTILFAFSSFVVNPSLFTQVPYDPVKSFEPVTLAVASTHVLTVNPSLPVSAMKELVESIRANPGKYSFASGGPGTQAHLLGEQLRLSQRLDLVHVPFNGAGPAVASVVAGHTPIGISTLASAATQIQAGQIRALAVTSKTRSPLLSDVPTTAEAGYPDIEGDGWVGVLVPAGAAKEIITLLHDEIVGIIAMADVKERLPTLGFDPVASTPDEFATRIKLELDTWARVIRAANIKAP
jgi:tripartite-type tricarboxylate transporter receptor subunit TctC